jgi:NAD(P)-dependent dehydrogenase (short-subunit alcohol dehydrogenase family)
MRRVLFVNSATWRSFASKAASRSGHQKVAVEPESVADALPTVVDEIHGYSVLRAVAARCVTRRTFLLPALLVAAVSSSSALALSTSQWASLGAVAACLQRVLVRGVQKHSTGDLAGRICVVTGGTAGLGLALVVRLLDRGAEVIVLSRSLALPEKADITRAFVVANAVDKEKALERLEFKAVDLGDPQSIAAVVAALRKEKYFIDVLVNNAGFFSDVPAVSKKCPALEQHVAANFVGPYALTEGLLPLLRASPRGGARVVYVTCSVHGNVRSGSMISTRLAVKPDSTSAFNIATACLGAAKLGCLYHVKQLSERRSEVVAGKLTMYSHPVLAVSVDPGPLNTKHFFESEAEPFLGNGVFGNCIRALAKKTPDEGAAAVLDCVSRPDLVNGGHYVECMHMPGALSRQAHNERQRADVMRWVAQRSRALGFMGK